MNGNKPTADQLHWREYVRECGCVLGLPGHVEVHHVAGRTAKHLKVPIGHWFLLGVSNKAHRIVERQPINEQKLHFVPLVAEYYQQFNELPFSGEVLLAIMDYHR